MKVQPTALPKQKPLAAVASDRPLIATGVQQQHRRRPRQIIHLQTHPATRIAPINVSPSRDAATTRSTPSNVPFLASACAGVILRPSLQQPHHPSSPEQEARVVGLPVALLKRRHLLWPTPQNRSPSSNSSRTNWTSFCNKTDDLSSQQQPSSSRPPPPSFEWQERSLLISKSVDTTHT